MSRFRLLVALTTVALVPAGVAVANEATITGGTATFTASSTAVSVVTGNHLTFTPLGPATLSGTAFTVPIAGGHLNSKLRGTIGFRGGFALSNGKNTIHVRRLTLRSSKTGVALWALVPRTPRGTCRMLATRPQRRLCRLALGPTVPRSHASPRSPASA